MVVTGVLQAKSQVEEFKNSKIDSVAKLMIKYHKDNSSSTLNKGISEDISLPKGEDNGMGFRVQIYMGTDRKRAYDEQARFQKIYPEVATYISYKQPNYRVKVGDYITREAAQKLSDELKPNFSTLFIFREQITPQKQEQKNNEATTITRED